MFSMVEEQDFTCSLKYAVTIYFTGEKKLELIISRGKKLVTSKMLVTFHSLNLTHHR